MAEKILLVDDDFDTLRLVGMMLESKGYQIIAANNGEKALELTRQNHPDLIILDIMMPGIDGFEVTRRLKAESDTKHIPIIIFTAKTRTEDKVLGLESGADVYLTKPITSRELFAQVKATLSRIPVTSPAEQKKKEHGHMIGITAPRGGLGVSTVTLNLGISLSQNTRMGVIVSDFRPGQGIFGLELGLGEKGGFHQLLNMYPEEITPNHVEKELIFHSSGIRLLASSSSPEDPRHAGAAGNFVVIAKHLSALGEIIVLDLGAGLSSINAEVFPLCQQVFIVVEPHRTTIYLAKSLEQSLVNLGLSANQIEYILVNRVRSSLQMTVSEVEDGLGKSLQGAITPHPELAYQASLSHIPMILAQPDNLPAQQFKGLAEKIAQRLMI